MRITQKGQVTIPQDIRERFGFDPHTEVEFVERNGEVILVKKTGRQGTRRFTSLRGSATVSLTTEEILSLTRK